MGGKNHPQRVGSLLAKTTSFEGILFGYPVGKFFQLLFGSAPECTEGSFSQWYSINSNINVRQKGRWIWYSIEKLILQLILLLFFFFRFSSGISHWNCSTAGCRILPKRHLQPATAKWAQWPALWLRSFEMIGMGTPKVLMSWCISIDISTDISWCIIIIIWYLSCIFGMVLTVHEVFSLLGSCNIGLCWKFGAPHFGCLCFLDEIPVFIVMPSWNHSNTLYQLALDTWRVRDPLKIIILKSRGIPASRHLATFLEYEHPKNP